MPHDEHPTDERVRTTTTIQAPIEAVFAVLADPAQHAAIDGTGRVRDPVDGELITHAGQVFRVDMFHENHPDRDYRMCNLVLDLDPPRTISWKPGYVADDAGNLAFGGWVWRYDLRPLGPGATEVTLTYDWSQAGPDPRSRMSFPPFPLEHFGDSLRHLAEIVE